MEHINLDLNGTTSVEVAFMDANTLRSSVYVICADSIQMSVDHSHHLSQVS